MNKEQFEEITAWQKKTFGQATAFSKIEHLKQEIEELLYDLRKNAPSNNVKMEFADCFFLLFGAAAAYGLSYKNICDAIQDKFEINKARKWGKPDANGVVNHIKE